MRTRRNANRRGGGYLQSQQWFDPDVRGPSGSFAPSTASTADAIRPVLLSTFQTGGTRRRHGGQRQKGGIKFSPSFTGGIATIGPLPIPIPYAYASLGVGPSSGGGSRRNRRSTRGGFVPSIMGSFIPNAQAAIVPGALYLAYHMLVPKKGSKSKGK